MKQLLFSTCVWLQGHPAFCVLVLWPVLTAALNLAWKDASAYADSHPRFAAFKKLLQKYGVSPRGTSALLGSLFTKITKLPPPDAGDPGADDSGSFGKLSAGIVPPPPPTKPDVGMRVRMLAAAFFALLMLLPLIGVIACSAPQTHQGIELGAYAAEQSLCDVEATDRDSGSACLAKVRAQYAPFWDAGADSGKDGAP